MSRITVNKCDVCGELLPDSVGLAIQLGPQDTWMFQRAAVEVSKEDLSLQGTYHVCGKECLTAFFTPKGLELVKAAAQQRSTKGKKRGTNGQQ